MATVLTPMVLVDLILFLAIIFLLRKQKEPKRRLWWFLAVFLLIVLSNSSPVAYVAIGSLEWQYPPSEEIPSDARAIVVLAGAVRSADRVRNRPELGPNTLYRCLHVATIHRTARDRLILLSGGKIDGEDSPTAATVMREFLLTQQVDGSKIILEERSQNTYENATESCKILREHGLHHIVLITDASHMPRAAACFRKQGVEVTPSPCNHIANDYHFAWVDLFPDVGSAIQVDTAWHEWLGMAFYKVRGRL